MSIVDTPEKDLSNVDHKYDMRKVSTYTANLSSTLFSCSIIANVIIELIMIKKNVLC